MERPDSDTTLKAHQGVDHSLDPILEPLLAQLQAISKELTELRALISLSAERVTELYKSATLITREPAAKLLSISTSKLDRDSAAGAIAPVRLDRRPRYALTDLEAYIKSRRHSHRRSRAVTEPVRISNPPTNQNSVQQRANCAKTKQQKSK